MHFSIPVAATSNLLQLSLTHLRTAFISEHATASCTFKHPLDLAISNASVALDNGKTAEMYFETSKFSVSSMRIASGNGPHREPTRLSSLTTYMDVLTVAGLAHVVFSTIVPMGITRAEAIRSPSGVPVTST